MVKLAVRVKHVHIFRKGAQTYVYFRKGDVKVRIRRDPVDVAGIQADVEKIERELAQRGQVTASRFEPSTLGWLIYEYKRTDWWTDLKPATQASYGRAFDAMAELLPRRLEWFDRPRILKLRDEALLPAYGRWMANMAVTVLGILFKFARDKRHMDSDPLAERVRKIRPRKGGPQANRPWTAAERHAVLDSASPSVRLVLVLAMCTGLRKADVFKVTMADVREEIAIITSKRDHPVLLPIHPLLAEAIAARKGPAMGKVCVRADGMPYTPDGFDTNWHRLKTKLEKEGKVGPGLTLHGLRHTLGTMLKEAGMADGDIADVLGQKTVSMARHYSKNAGLSSDTKAKIVALKMSRER
jgi:integrase